MSGPSVSPATAGHAPRWGRRAGLLSALLVVAALLTVPWWGYNLAYFRIRSVQVRGTRFARPSEIAARLSVDTSTSIWQSLDVLRTRVERHPQVRSAVVRRWLPNTVIVEIDENEPVALVPGPKGMRAYEESGQALPLDPSRVPTDLPIVERADTAVLRLLADLKADQSEMFAQISEVRFVGQDELRIQLLDIVVRARRGLVAQRFSELSSVQRDLARRRVTAAELDLRFKDLVIARLP